jgi:glycerol kinase
LADLTGLRVERRNVREATARGIAFLAAGQPEGWEAVPVETVFEPASNPALAARHAHWRSEMALRGAR